MGLRFIKRRFTASTKVNFDVNKDSHKIYLTISKNNICDLISIELKLIAVCLSETSTNNEFDLFIGHGIYPTLTINQ